MTNQMQQNFHPPPPYEPPDQPLRNFEQKEYVPDNQLSNQQGMNPESIDFTENSERVGIYENVQDNVTSFGPDHNPVQTSFTTAQSSAQLGNISAQTGHIPAQIGINVVPVGYYPAQAGYSVAQTGYNPAQSGYIPPQNGYYAVQTGYHGPGSHSNPGLCYYNPANQQPTTFYVPTVTVVQQQAKPPPTYMERSIVTFIFCCWIIGLAAIFKSLAVDKANKEGRWEEAEKQSGKARKYNWAALFVGLFFWVSISATVVTLYVILI